MYGNYKEYLLKADQTLSRKPGHTEEMQVPEQSYLFIFALV